MSFGRVFESLTEFSKVSLKMYNDLVSRENADKVETPTFIEEASQVEDAGR